MCESEVIHEAVERICRSSTFCRSSRLQRLFRRVVEANRESEGPKEYTLGIEVFDRPASFDPRTDPIVRVEMRRLRAKLREYYKREGRTDPITIGVAKGRYVPEIRERMPRRKQPIGIARMNLVSQVKQLADQMRTLTKDVEDLKRRLGEMPAQKSDAAVLAS